MERVPTWWDIRYVLDRKKDGCPKIELGSSLTYIPDKNKYIYFGGLQKDIVVLEGSETERKEVEEREKEEMEGYSLYYRQEYMRMKKANVVEYVYIYDPRSIDVI